MTLNIFCQKIENLHNWMDNLWQKKVENIVAKGEIACFVSSFVTMFSKSCLLQRCLYEGKGYTIVMSLDTFPPFLFKVEKCRKYQVIIIITFTAAVNWISLSTIVFSMFKMNVHKGAKCFYACSTLSHIQQICSSQLWNYLGKNTDNHSKCRYNPFPDSTILQQTTEHILSKIGKSL